MDGENNNIYDDISDDDLDDLIENAEADEEVKDKKTGMWLFKGFILRTCSSLQSLAQSPQSVPRLEPTAHHPDPTVSSKARAYSPPPRDYSQFQG